MQETDKVKTVNRTYYDRDPKRYDELVEKNDLSLKGYHNYPIIAELPNGHAAILPVGSRDTVKFFLHTEKTNGKRILYVLSYHSTLDYAGLYLMEVEDDWKPTEDKFEDGVFIDWITAKVRDDFFDLPVKEKFNLLHEYLA